MKHDVPRPTESELAILRVLWAGGPATVRQVHRAMARQKQTSYNTTLKLLQIMLAKGIVARDESERPQIYRPALAEAQMQRRLTVDFLERVFGGSARKLMTALAGSNVSREELAEIRQLLDQFEKGKL